MSVPLRLCYSFLRNAVPAVSVNVNDASQTETEAIPGDSGRVNLGDD